jgi:hypothetical protein
MQLVLARRPADAVWRVRGDQGWGSSYYSFQFNWYFPMLGISCRPWDTYPSTQWKYRKIPLSTIPTVELYRSKAKTLPTIIITEEEERRISVTTAISASTANNNCNI